MRIFDHTGDDKRLAETATDPAKRGAEIKKLSRSRTTLLDWLVRLFSETVSQTRRCASAFPLGAVENVSDCEVSIEGGR